VFQSVVFFKNESTLCSLFQMIIEFEINYNSLSNYNRIFFVNLLKGIKRYIINKFAYWIIVNRKKIYKVWTDWIIYEYGLKYKTINK